VDGVPGRRYEVVELERILRRAEEFVGPGQIQAGI
jgi:hypothetical protein